MERMNTLDAGFYLVDHQNVPMHLGSVAVFDGPAPQLADLADLYAARLTRVPRCRQVVRTSAWQLRRPVWIDAPNFHISDHLRQAPVPAPGNDGQLCEVAARIFAKPLDMRKPLWEAWLLGGLAGGRWAVLSKVHHCVVDGIGGSDLMTAVFGSESGRAGDGPADWRRASSRPGPAEAAAWPIRQMAAAGGSLLTQLPAMPDVLSYGVGLAHAARRLAAPSVRSLNGPAGESRRWAWTSIGLDDIREIRAELGGTVNDVLLAAIAGGFRAQLPDAALASNDVVRSLVPVSLRSATESGAMTNRLSAVLVNLPVGEREPLRRLELIRAQTDELKRTHQAAGPELITALLEPVAPSLLALALRAAFRLPQPLVQTVTTNVPGPRDRLFALGRPLVAIYPYAPIGGNVRTSVAIYAYSRILYFGVTSDYNAVAEPARLTRSIDSELDTLTRLARRDQTPTTAAISWLQSSRREPGREPLRLGSGHAAGSRRSPIRGAPRA
jgi:diacylglycerol O-acyltransferase / wax synthase